VRAGNPRADHKGRSDRLARIGDTTSHGGIIVSGCPTVIIGDLAPPPLVFIGKPCLKAAANAGAPFLKA